MTAAVHAAGPRALLVELESAAETAALHAELLRRRAADELPALREIVPGARTVLLDGFATAAARDALAAALPRWRPAPVEEADAPEVRVPVRYDGPDLADVAAAWDVPPARVPAIHTSTAYRVAFSGFAPGFGYLTGLPERYAVPRRATPRTRVPAGSVALAGPYTGVYPQPSPGGWQLIGTTDAALWDPEREPAALLTPGTRVVFTDVDAREDR